MDGGCWVDGLVCDPDFLASVSEKQDAPGVVFDSRKSTFIWPLRLKFISIYVTWLTRCRNPGKQSKSMEASWWVRRHQQGHTHKGQTFHGKLPSQPQIQALSLCYTVACLSSGRVKTPSNRLFMEVGIGVCVCVGDNLLLNHVTFSPPLLPDMTVRQVNHQY